MSFNEVLKQLQSNNITDTAKEQGTLFEKLIKKILQTSPLFTTRFKEVYLWNEFSAKYNLKSQDIGIDIMAITYNNEYVSIQCKCFDSKHILQQSDLKNFLGIDRLFDAHNNFICDIAEKLIFHTCEIESSNYQKAITQSTNAKSYSYYHLAQELGINWNSLNHKNIESSIENLSLEGKKSLRDYQKQALEAIKHTFLEQNKPRAKVIMACGTGKSLLSIRAIDSIIQKGEICVFFAPSLALINQMLKDFFKESSGDYRVFAVCSDSKVGLKVSGGGVSEDSKQDELIIPPTTDHSKLAQYITHYLESHNKIIIFSTYQSIDTIINAQKYFKHQIKLIINDEAHRTAGYQKLDSKGEAPSELSVWQKTHDNTLLNAKHRLYMTATPRIYGDTLEKRQEAKKTLKDKSGKDLLLFDMGDEELFGSEIFSLKFGEAIKRNILSDYRVIISFMSEELIAQYLGTLTKAQEHSKLSIHDAGQMIGFANALTKKNIVLIDTDGSQQTPDSAKDVFGDTSLPMRRALCFHSSIKHSKFVTNHFKVISQDITLCHIDGTDNAAEKAKKLSWLSEEEEEGKCRVLSNAKCLTEGIDVPSLDAIAFFDPRDSVVDIVQAVGRAIRKSEGKKYGYIILPIVLSDKEIQEYDKTLKSDKFKGIWKVLKALRSHDERLVDIGRINEVVKITADAKESQSLPEATLFALQELFDNMKNAIPKHLGDLAYWELYGAKVGGIMHSLALRIKDLLENHNDIKALFESFCKALQGNLNASFDTDEATALIAQHIIIKPIFECIFPNLDFSTFDKVSHELDKLYQELCALGLESEVKDLQRFYESVKHNAEYAQSDRSKQDLIRNLYDRLFKEAFKKTQEKLGIVYTPIEVVDFIIHSINYALKKHFGKNLSDTHINICDPFTGTGTFITRLIQSGYLDSNLESKYKKELWANEITLLGYYIAQINITTAYHERLSKLKETSALGKHLSDLENFEGSQTISLALPPKFPKNPQSPTANLGSLDSQISCHSRQSKDSMPLESRPLRGAEHWEKGGSSASANAKLEADKRGSPLDCRKSGVFFGVKGSGVGINPFLREKENKDFQVSFHNDNEQAREANSLESREKHTLFDNLLFTDTFNTYTPDSKGFQGKKEDPQLFNGEYLKKNYDKIQEFKNTDFKVFVGNPPYSANQSSSNDNNANTSYPYLEARMQKTYLSKTNSTYKGKMYDSLKLAMRYCSDRIGESGGIIGFVTNGSFIEGNADSGLRACLESEFDYIYIFNLRGNARLQGEARQKEGGGVFDSGSRTPVAISILIKCRDVEETQNANSLESSSRVYPYCDENQSHEVQTLRASSGRGIYKGEGATSQFKPLPLIEKENKKSFNESGGDSSVSTKLQNDNKPKKKARIYYYDIGDYKSREEKLNILANLQSIEGLEGRFQTITPNQDYDWINQRDYSFMAFMPMAHKKLKEVPLKSIPTLKNTDKLDSEVLQKDYVDIFEMYSQGILTSRDAWVYNFSKENLESNMTKMIANYNAEVQKLESDSHYKPNMDKTRINWSRALNNDFQKKMKFSFHDSGLIVSTHYRPFTKCHLYLAKYFNEMLYQMPQIYPTPQTQKIALLGCEAGFEAYAEDFFKTYKYLPNLTICINGLGGSKEFASLMSDRLTEYGTLSNSQCFPLYYYEKLDSTMSKEESLLNGISEAEYKQMQDNPHSSFYRRKDAIRDEALDKFREVYKAPRNVGDSTLLLSQMRNCSFQARGERSLASLNDRAESAESAIYRCEISKDSIFYYLYALLNHPTYKEKYKDNLSKMLPRIPFMKDFWGFENAGRALAQLHLNYESFAEACLDSSNGAFACLKSKINDFKGQNLFHPKEEAIRDIQALQEKDFTINKLRFEAKGKLDTIIFNEHIAIVHIPLKAYEYKVNGKSPIEWIMDRYQVKIDKDSQILNDPNLYECEEGALKGLKGGKYVLYLLLSVIEMSMRTMKTLESLPAYEVIEA